MQPLTALLQDLPPSKRTEVIDYLNLQPPRVSYKPAYPLGETSAIFAVSRTTLYNWIDAGSLRTFTMGARRFVSGEAMSELIHTREAADRAARDKLAEST